MNEIMILEKQVQDPVEAYSSLLPPMLKNSLSGFRHKNQKAIIMVLDLYGRRSFSQIQTDLHLSKNDLSYHLKSLENSGLVRNEIKKVSGTREYSWYLLTNFGMNLLKSLLEVYLKGIYNKEMKLYRYVSDKTTFKTNDFNVISESKPIENPTEANEKFPYIEKQQKNNSPEQDDSFEKTFSKNENNFIIKYNNIKKDEIEYIDLEDISG